MPTKHDGILWQTAGFAAENGHIDRPISSQELIIPAADIDGEDVIWGTDWAQAQFRQPGKGILSDFLKLHNASDDRVLQYVRHWGALQFGPAFARVLRLEASIPVTPEVIADFAKHWIGPGLCGRHLDHRDPIGGYKALSSHVRWILLLAKDIEDAQISDSTWVQRYPYHCESCLFGKSAAIDEVRLKVNWLIRLGGVSFTLERDDVEDRWRTAISYGYCSTLGALAMQIVLMASRADSLYTCSGCGMPYVRTYTHRRRPKPNQNNYCDECGENDRAEFDAKKRYRQKIQEARRLHAARIPIDRIAEQLDTEPERVENWIRGHQTVKARKRTKAQPHKGA